MPRPISLLLVKGRSSSTGAFILELSNCGTYYMVPTPCRIGWWWIIASNCIIPKMIGSQTRCEAFAAYLNKKKEKTERKNNFPLCNSDCNYYQKEIFSCFVLLGSMVFIWQVLNEEFCVRHFVDLTNIYAGHLASDQLATTASISIGLLLSPFNKEPWRSPPLYNTSHLVTRNL